MSQPMEARPRFLPLELIGQTVFGPPIHDNQATFDGHGDWVNAVVRQRINKNLAEILS